MKTIFGNNARRSAQELNALEIIESIEEVYLVGFSIADKLKDCKHFTFFEGDESRKITKDASTNQRFWLELNILIILCLRSSAASFIKLAESISMAFDSRNELILAMAMRSFIEHTCMIDDLSFSFEKRTEYLVDQIWPPGSFFFSEQPPKPADFELREALVRFALGRKVQLKEGIPSALDSQKKWDKYMKSIRHVPEELAPDNIMKLIDRTNLKHKIKLLRVIYEVLCEYAHPNAASRIFSFKQNYEGKTYSLKEFAGKYSEGFRQIILCCNLVIPDQARLAKESLLLLDRCRKPMESFLFGSKEQKPGYMKSTDWYGREIWVDPAKATSAPIKYRSLSGEQKEKVRKIYNVFRDVDMSPFENWIEDFSKEPDFDKEIGIWKHIIKVYQRELSDRLSTDAATRRKIYDIIRLTTTGHEPHEIIIRNPEYRAVTFFDRIISRSRKGGMS